MSEELKIDGRFFNTPLDAAMHVIRLLDLLSDAEGSPADGPRFREGILAGRDLIKQLKPPTKPQP